MKSGLGFDVVFRVGLSVKNTVCLLNCTCGDPVSEKTWSITQIGFQETAGIAPMRSII